MPTLTGMMPPPPPPPPSPSSLLSVSASASRSNEEQRARKRHCVEALAQAAVSLPDSTRLPLTLQDDREGVTVQVRREKVRRAPSEAELLELVRQVLRSPPHTEEDVVRLVRQFTEMFVVQGETVLAYRNLSV